MSKRTSKHASSLGCSTKIFRRLRPKRNFVENGLAIYTVNSLWAKLLFVLNQSGRRHMVPRRGPGNSRKRSVKNCRLTT